MPEKNWYVIYTKPRSEKKVAERLRERGFETYCPLVKTIRTWSDRKKKVDVPMFTSYVFVKIVEHERSEILTDPGVLNFIFWLGKPAIVREEEIETIRNIADYSEDVEVSQMKVEKGQLMKISEGPFKGMFGEIVDTSSNVIIIFIKELGCKIQFRYSKRFLEAGK